MTLLLVSTSQAIERNRKGAAVIKADEDVVPQKDALERLLKLLSDGDAYGYWW